MADQVDNKVKDKEFPLTSFSVKNRTTVYVLTFIIIILGVLSYVSLPKETFPEVKIPTIYVGTSYPGNSPKDIENLITRPIEKEINTIDNIDEMSSTSVQDYSTVVVKFTNDMETTEVLRKVKDAVDRAKSELPDDLDNDPDVFELDFGEFPIMNINLSGEYNNEELKDYAEYAEDKIEALPEVSEVNIRGLDEKEVEISVDPHKMEALEISYNDLQNAISNENVTLSGGNLKMGHKKRSVRVVGEFDHPREISNIIVKDEKQNIVYLKDIAEVTFGYKEKESYARLGGKPVVMLDVVKKSEENLIQASNKINAIIEEAKADYFPGDLQISVTNDQTDQTRTQVNNLENNIISGVILVTLILLFFLGSRNALFVGIAIPLSMFTSFMVIGFLGIVINMMVLFALIMALGMLVDNGIVVVENVYRLLEEGYKITDAVKQGVGEVALPIISSTATTLAAFLPLAFWPGIMGEFMFYLPITLIITLTSSLFVALVINPVLIDTFMKLSGDESYNYKKIWILSSILTIAGIMLTIPYWAGYWENMAENGSAASPLLSNFFTGLGNFLIVAGLLVLLNVYLLLPATNKFANKILPKVDNFYQRFLTKVFHGNNPLWYFIGTIILLIFALTLLATFTPKVSFFPDNEPKYVNVFIELPTGTDIEYTNTITKKLENDVEKIIAPYSKAVESVISYVGKGASDPMDLTAVGQQSTPNKARINIAFVKFENREGIQTSQILEKIRKNVMEIPGVTITVKKDQVGPPVGEDINIEVSGEKYEKIIDITNELKSKIQEAEIHGIEALKSNLEKGKPELIVNLDREKSRRFGVSTAQVANVLRTALFGQEVSQFKQGEDDYPIMVRLNEKYRHDLDALLNQHITFRDPATGRIKQVPVSALADIRFTSSYGAIKRKDLDRVITLSSNVLEGSNATEINNQIKALVKDMNIPKGYDIKFTGEQEQQAQEMAFLFQALMTAVFLIFLIIVAQFNKISAPFIIMSSVIFSTIGVYLGLVIFQMEFIVIMTMIGIISLAGIVVNNAIVLIDFIEITRDRKRKALDDPTSNLNKQELISAIIEGGKTRLRPVILTALTTIFGLIPLAAGININFITLLTDYDPQFFIGGDTVMFWQPISLTIIFGLIFATFITLVIVPVMYFLSEQIKRSIKPSQQ